MLVVGGPCAGQVTHVMTELRLFDLAVEGITDWFHALDITSHVWAPFVLPIVAPPEWLVHAPGEPEKAEPVTTHRSVDA